MHLIYPLHRGGDGDEGLASEEIYKEDKESLENYGKRYLQIYKGNTGQKLQLVIST